MKNITPYEGRQVDLTKPVHVYRNLTSDNWSISQGKYVVGHAEQLYLRDVTFKVRKAGRNTVRATGKKNVHAFVVGYVIELGQLHDEEKKLLKDDDDTFPYFGVRYNPMDCYQFMNKCRDEPIFRADWVDMDLDSDTMPIMAIFTPENAEKEWPAESVRTVNGF